MVEYQWSIVQEKCFFTLKLCKYDILIMVLLGLHDL